MVFESSPSIKSLGTDSTHECHSRTEFLGRLAGCKGTMEESEVYCVEVKAGRKRGRACVTIRDTRFHEGCCIPSLTSPYYRGAHVDLSRYVCVYRELKHEKKMAMTVAVAVVSNKIVIYISSNCIQDWADYIDSGVRSC